MGKVYDKSDVYENYDLQKFIKNFPEFVTEQADENGKLQYVVDFDAFRKKFERHTCDDPVERFRFEWSGKAESYKVAHESLKKINTVKPQKTESVNFDNTQNVFIEGDNLSALKILRESYNNKIKMIYIDPPYNTGKDFVYSDKFTQDSQEYQKATGQIDEDGNTTTANKETNGRFHSNWLSMMYPRLKLAKELLSDDGVIFVSIDDHEVHHLRLIMDEIFGSENFYGELIQPKGNTQNDAKTIQKNHEYILVYCKTTTTLLLTYNNVIMHEIFENSFYLGRDTGSSSGHDKLLERPNLGYTIYYYEGTVNVATGNHNKLLEIPNLASKKHPGFSYFNNGNKIVHAIAVVDYFSGKITGKSQENDVYKDDEELLSLGYIPIRPPKRKGDTLGRWTWGLETFKEFWNKNEVLIKNNKNVIKKEFVNQKDIEIINGKKWYIKTNNLPIQSILKIINSPGTSMLSGNDGLMPGIDFNNPKNPALLKYFIQSYHGGTSEKTDFIVLDFFAGSGTTAHAVMELNAEDGGTRKFICVQLDEKCAKDSAAYQAGYNTISDICRERIRRAGKKILEDHPDAKVDIGFKSFKVSDSNFITHDYEEMIDANQLQLLNDTIKPDATNEDLLYEILLQNGHTLTANIVKENLCDIEFFIIDSRLIVCLSDNLTLDFMHEIYKKSPEKFICKECAFHGDDVLRYNTSLIFSGKNTHGAEKVITFETI